MKSFSKYLLIIFHNLLCFVQQDVNRKGFVLIKFKYALRNIEAHFDRSDPRQLNIITTHDNTLIDFVVCFEDMGKTSNIKQSIEENRKSARNTEYLLLDSYFDELINNIKF